MEIFDFLRSPIEARARIIASNIRYDTPYYLASHIHVYLTGRCNIACDHCIFSSEMTNSLSKASLTHVEVELASKYISESKATKLTISGGGEPFLEPKELFFLLSNTSTRFVEIDTAGYWAQTKGSTVQIFKQISRTIQANPHRPKLILRVSADRFHRSAPDPVPLANYVNIIQVWLEDNWGFDLGLRGLLLDDDDTALLIANAVGGLIEPVTEWNKRLLLPGGKRIPLTFNVMRFEGKGRKFAHDLSDSTMRIENYFKPIQNENGDLVLGMTVNDLAYGSFYRTNGLNIGINFDGFISIYASSSPDMCVSLQETDYQQSIKHFYKDPITHLLLSRGIYALTRIVSEIDSRTVQRALRKNHFGSLVNDLLENETIRLYATIRCLQLLVDSKTACINESALSNLILGIKISGGGPYQLSHENMSNRTIE